MALDQGDSREAITQLQTFVDQINVLVTGEHWQPELGQRLTASATALISRFRSRAR